MKLTILVAVSSVGLAARKSTEPQVNWVENIDQQVILVGRESGGVPSNVPSRGPGPAPSNFPTPGQPRPSRPVFTPKYRRAPKPIRQGQGLGGAANPGGSGDGGGNPGADNQTSVPKENANSKPVDRNYDPTLHSSDKKKSEDTQVEAEQCEADETSVNNQKLKIINRTAESPALDRVAKKAKRNQMAQKDIDHLIEQLALGNNNPGTGNRRLKSL